MSMCRVFSCVVGKGCLLWPVHSLGKNLPVTPGISWLPTFAFPSPMMKRTSFRGLEKEMAAHSSVLAWRIPGAREPGGLPSVWSHRVGHDWSDLAAAGALEGLIGLHRSIQFQLLALVVGALTWITVILSSLAWKRTEIILLLLNLHPSTAFWSLLLTSPFLLRDLAHSSRYNGHLN